MKIILITLTVISFILFFVLMEGINHLREENKPTKKAKIWLAIDSTILIILLAIVIIT